MRTRTFIFMIIIISGIKILKPEKKLKDNGHRKFIKLTIVQDMKVHQLGFMLIIKVFGKILHQPHYPEGNIQKGAITMLL